MADKTYKPRKSKKKTAEPDIEEMAGRLDDEMTDKEFITTLIDIAKVVPTEVYLSIILTYAWCKTHKGMINKNDVLAGSLGGFTLPSAFKGGWVSNMWAVGYLGTLGYNYVDTMIDGDDIEQDIYAWLAAFPDYIVSTWAGVGEDLGKIEDAIKETIPPLNPTLPKDEYEL